MYEIIRTLPLPVNPVPHVSAMSPLDFGAPPDITEGQLDADRTATTLTECPACAAVGVRIHLDLVPHQRGGEYAPLAVCPECSYQAEFQPRAVGAMPRALRLPARAAVTVPVVALPELPAPENLPELLAAPQLAKMMSFSVRTVWRMVERGELPQPIRFNRKLVRFSTRTVLEFLDAQRKVVQG